MEVPAHRVARSRQRIVALDADELIWRYWRWWSPIDWFYWARTALWAKRTF
jgi:hypothetical protein